MISQSNLLGVHPEIFSSHCSTPPQTTRTARSLTEIRTHLSATPLEGQSGYLAESHPSHTWKNASKYGNYCELFFFMKSALAKREEFIGTLCGLCVYVRTINQSSASRSALKVIFEFSALKLGSAVVVTRIVTGVSQDDSKHQKPENERDGVRMQWMWTMGCPLLLHPL